MSDAVNVIRRRIELFLVSVMGMYDEHHYSCPKAMSCKTAELDSLMILGSSFCEDAPQPTLENAQRIWDTRIQRLINRIDIALCNCEGQEVDFLHIKNPTKYENERSLAFQMREKRIRLRHFDHRNDCILMSIAEECKVLCKAILDTKKIPYPAQRDRWRREIEEFKNRFDAASCNCGLGWPDPITSEEAWQCAHRAVKRCDEHYREVRALRAQHADDCAVARRCKAWYHPFRRLWYRVKAIVAERKAIYWQEGDHDLKSRLTESERDTIRTCRGHRFADWTCRESREAISDLFSPSVVFAKICTCERKNDGEDGKG